MKRSQPELRRTLGLTHVILYGVGLILGAGIYVIIGDVSAIAGNAIWASFILAAFIALFTGLSYAELASMFPKSAAEYIYVKHAFGKNFIASFVGCLTILVAITSAATVDIGFAGYFSVFFPSHSSIAYAVILVTVLSFLNFYGIRESAWTNSVFTIVEVSGLVLIIIAGILMGSYSETNFFELPKVASSSIDSAILAILTSTALIFFAYYGFENISNLSEETRNPTRVIPKALLISILITSVIYVLVSISSIALIGWKELSSSEAPLAVAAAKAFGNYGIILLSIIALFATTNTVLMMLVSGSRIIFGMARDGAISDAFSKIQRNTRTPWVATFTMMTLVIASVILSFGNIVTMASLSVFGIFVVFGFVNYSVIWLRFKQPNLIRPFASPISVKKFPVLAGLGLISTIIMILQFEKNVAASAYLIMASIFVLCVFLTMTQKKSKHTTTS
ncbi:MAG: APC family permease [Candidatus Eiseniibacteriota bacterium]